MTAEARLVPQIEAEVRASFAKQGLMTSFGASITTLAPGRCTITLPYSEAVGQQHGFFHGGIIGAVGDTAGGYAALTVLPSGSEVLTLEYKINFLRPAAGALLMARRHCARPCSRASCRRRKHRSRAIVGRLRTT